MKKLQSADRDCSGALYSLEFSKDLSKIEAKKELKKLGVDLKMVALEEFEDEEELESEE
ncbi:MAG TPA: hypothetical protein VFE88_03550 [Candidatus Nanoarchaeia archaeon]|nr:hypothetical protein [Candidatus Nanoarchaeia archaeon]